MTTKALNDFFLTIDAYLGGAEWFVVLLLLTGLFFTVYLRFPQIRFFRHALYILSGKADKEHHEGDSTHFQSLATALSGTIGTGNIAGVALAIHLGGPSALFWMLVTALLGMTTKLVEVTLSHRYREKAEDGTISGGPMYYMRDGVKLRWLAALFAVATILCAFGTGSLPQINSISNSMFTAFGVEQWITGMVLTVVLGIIIIGGVKRIVRVSEMLIPFMTLIFILAGVLVLIYNRENIIPSIVSIFSGIFSGSAATGGFLGAGFAWAFNRGVNRGLFSNEAGQGSAPIAHAAARTDEPVSEGIVALLEPFIDTVIICMMTGLVLLCSGAWHEKFENKFQQTDMIVLDGLYAETIEQDKSKVAEEISTGGVIPRFSGTLTIKDGRFPSGITLLHARSFAEEVKVMQNKTPFSGSLNVSNGAIDDARFSKGEIEIFGKSLMHSAPLSTQAFSRSYLGDLGRYVVPVALLLFAFSTAVAWFYYASRAVIYLWGVKWVRAFQIIYLAGFFVASFIDTSLIWSFSGVAIAFMTLPNLVSILILRKEAKKMIDDYASKFIK